MRRFLKFALVGFAVLIVALSIAGVLVLRSAWFREKVRSRIITEVERVTGGTVALGSFDLDWRTLSVELKNFDLQGREDPDQPHLFHSERINLDINIISAFQRKVDLARLIVEKPQVHIYTDLEGRTNIPSPKVRRPPSGRTPIAELLRAKIKTLVLRDGYFQYDSRRIPLSIEAEHFDSTLDYDFDGPRYNGEFAARNVRVKPDVVGPFNMAFLARITLYGNEVLVHEGQLNTADSHINIAGRVLDLRQPNLDFRIKGEVSLAEFGEPLRLPIVHKGRAAFDGTLMLHSASDYNIEGKLNARGLGWNSAGVKVDPIAVTGQAHVTPGRIRLDNMTIDALDGKLYGTAEIARFRSFTVKGNVEKFSVVELSRFQTAAKHMAWNGLVSGPVTFRGDILDRGIRNFLAQGKVRIDPAPDTPPLEGELDVVYDQRASEVRFQYSWLSTPSTRVQFEGTMGKQLTVAYRSTDLDDILPAVAMFTENPPRSLPVRLEKGEATFQGQVTGPLAAPTIQGAGTLQSFVFENRRIQRLSANIAINENSLDARNVTIEVDGAHADGNLRLGLSDWKPTESSAMSGSVQLKNADVQKLLEQSGTKLPVTGTLSGSATFAGTVGDPRVEASVLGEKLVAWDEPFARLRATLRYESPRLQVLNAAAELAEGGRVQLTGNYRHGPRDYRNAQIDFTATAAGVDLKSIDAIRQRTEKIAGRIDAKASGAARLVNTQLEVDRVDGRATLRNLVVAERPLGNVNLTAETKGGVLALGLQADFRGSNIVGGGQWRLAGDYPGNGKFTLNRVGFETLNALIRPNNAQVLPFTGFVEGTVDMAGPLRKPEEIKAELRIPSIELRPRPGAVGVAQTRVPELTLRNAGPVIVSLERNSAVVQQAQFTSQGTDLRISGRIGFNERNPWSLQVLGNVNLAIAQNFNNDLRTSGSAIVNASVRGSLASPQVSGRMELKDASLYYREITSGLDKANGVLVFDRNRAILENFTAQSGGGDLALTGFVGFGGPELLYRLHGVATHVRLRYPEGVSTTLNATLDLTGTTQQSLLAGEVTILRAGFIAQTDVGALLAGSAKPVETPAAPSPFLAGMQLDVRVESAPNLEFQTSLTQDVQAEAALRVRGSPAKPILLGRMTVTQGEIRFFGNKYRINRGDISFFNPARIEPVLDMDLETRVRAVNVNITFTGPLNRLNITYRSDPPLQSSEIIALLAVGRAPGETPTLAGSQTVSTQGAFDTPANTLLEQAIAAPLSSRLQRFFGISRLKIDPRLTGLDTTPQARLTIEQQISRSLTITYVTNLTNAQQQLVRLEWDLSRTWSVIAVRDENGLFGIDFLYRKQFK